MNILYIWDCYKQENKSRLQQLVCQVVFRKKSHLIVKKKMPTLINNQSNLFFTNWPASMSAADKPLLMRTIDISEIFWLIQ